MKSIDNDEEIAFKILNKAIVKSKELLTSSHFFKPFIILLDDNHNIELYDNELLSEDESYFALEHILEERVKKDDVYLFVLVRKSYMPQQFKETRTSAIRVHIEEKSQLIKKISARFLYIPYELKKSGNECVDVVLGMPKPVGFPAEYIV